MRSERKGGKQENPGCILAKPKEKGGNSKEGDE